MESPGGSERPPKLRRRGWTDVQVEVVISVILRVGLIVAAAVVVVGGAIYLLRHGHELISYRVFHGEPPVDRSIPEIVRAAAGLRGRAFIMAGLVLLIATPVVRVAFSVVAFLRERDWIYVGVTLFVLAILLWSILGGATG